MINKISAIRNNNYNTTVNFKSKELANDNKTKSVEASSLQAQANYGIAQVKLSKLIDIAPAKSQLLESTNPDDYEGVKVYDSKGNFAGIVNKNDRTTSYYLPNDKEDKISQIKIIDNKTNKLICQETLENNYDSDYISVEEFSSITGKQLTETNYRNGEFVHALKFSYSRNGGKTAITYDPNSKIYNVSEHGPKNNQYSSISFSKDFKHTIFKESFEKGNVKYDRGVRFHEGAMISTYDNKSTVIPNMIGREVLNDPDLIPARKFNPNTISSSLKEGEKTYFTNGSIETITNKEMSAKYSLNGDLTEFESKNIKVYFYPNNIQEIEEKLNNDISKTTIYDSDGDIIIKYQNGDKSKRLYLNSKYQIENYDETDENSDDKIWLKDFYYQNGMLSEVYNY